METTKIDISDIKEIKFILWNKEEYFSFDLLLKDKNNRNFNNLCFSWYSTSWHYKILDEINNINSDCKIRLFFWDSSVNWYNLDWGKDIHVNKGFIELVDNLNGDLDYYSNLVIYYNPSNHSKFLRIDDENIFSSQNYWAEHYFNFENWTYIKFKNNDKLNDYYDKFEKFFLNDDNTIILYWIKNIYWNYNNININDLWEIFNNFFSIEDDINKLLSDIEYWIDDLLYCFDYKKWESNIDFIEDTLIKYKQEYWNDFLDYLYNFNDLLIRQKITANNYLKFWLKFDDKWYIARLDKYIDYFSILHNKFKQLDDFLNNVNIYEVFEILLEIDFDYLFNDWLDRWWIIWNYQRDLQEIEDDFESLEENNLIDYKNSKEYIELIEELKLKYSWIDFNNAETPDDLNDFFRDNIYIDESFNKTNHILNNDWYKLLKKINTFITELHSINKMNNVDLDLLCFINFE